MKFIINPYLRIILIVSAWLLCVRQAFINFEHSHFLDFGFPLLILLAGIISLASFLIDYFRYKGDRKWVSFFSTAVSVLFIAALIGLTQYFKQQDRSPTVLYAFKPNNFLDKFSINFRKNGTYKFTNGSLFGDLYYTRGHYSIKDSIIYLDKTYLSGLLVVRQVENDNHFKRSKSGKKRQSSLLAIRAIQTGYFT
jgi:hypothetical protein